MEEQVDQIIIPILSEIGCTFENDVKTIIGFNSQQFVQAASRMVMKIKPEQPIPHRLPKSKAARFRVCTTLASAIQELGFEGDLGYEKFLYPNDKDTRAVLIWLMNKLPKADEALDEDEGAGDDTVQISTALKQWFYERYDPFINDGSSASIRISTTQLMTPDQDEPSKFELEYYKKHQRAVSLQPSPHSRLAPSIMELNVKDICLAQERQAAFDAGEKSSAEKRALISEQLSQVFSTEKRIVDQSSGGRKKLHDVLEDIMKSYGGDSGTAGQEVDSQFTRKVAFEEETESSAQVVQDGGTVKQVTEAGEEVKEEDEDAIREKQDKRLAELQDEAKRLQGQVNKILKKMEEFTSAARQIDGDVNSKQQEVKELMEKYTLKKRTLKLLPDAEKNLEKLKSICDASEQRVLKMGDQWEGYRVPQFEKYRREKQLLSDRKNEVRKKVDMIRRMRKEMKQMAQDIRKKDEQYKQLVVELNKLPKSINRQVYIRRIMDIMKNLDKQKAQIKVILNDVRGVQRDINNVSDTSGRSFNVTEKVVFDAAKSTKSKSADTTGLRAYEQLAKLRDGFDKLVTTVEDTGKTKNAIRAYETQIDALEAQNTGLSMKRVADDLKQIKSENKTLTAKLRNLKG